MKKFLLPENGKFYKSNLHCHTNISDGSMSPSEVKEHYKNLGYSVVCYTDHEVLIGHKDLCDGEFLALHGYEVAIKQDLYHHTGNFMPVYHFNMIAEDQDNLIMPRCYEKNPSMPGNAGEWFEKYKPYDKNDTISETVYDIAWLNEYLPAVRDGGFLITYNHPQWSLQDCTDFLGLKGLHAIEAINGGCIYHGDCTTIHFEQMLRHGMNVIPVAGDDNHSLRECGRGWTMIKAEALTYDAIISAYKNGDCYVSTGPEILALYIEDGKIVVKTSPDTLVTLKAEGRYIRIAQSNGEVSFDYNPAGFGKYFRIEVKDNSGKVAFSRAYMTSEIEQ